jgi:cbb3-type cytochrome oxidase subunit 3
VNAVLLTDTIIALKVGVTVAFFVVFSGIIAFTYARAHREALEAHRYLPLREGRAEALPAAHADRVAPNLEEPRHA